MRFTPRPHIMEIEPYIPGASKASAAKIIKLSSNENPFGPSPLAIEAYKNCAENIHRYPDGASTELREALAKKHGIDAHCIVCGTGSDELITLLCRAYCGEGDEVIYTRHGFLMYPIAALSAGARPIKADEPDRCTDLNEILKCVSERTKIIFLANPNNPTGATISRSDLMKFHAALPSHVMLVLDAAYAEYVEAEDYICGKDMVTKFDNVVMLRTFSKIYGLGGMRVGWSYSSLEIADVLNRVRGIFNLNIAVQAAAVAALKDEAYVQKSLINNATQKKYISEALGQMGIYVYEGEGNFILFSMGSVQKAEACLSFLKDRGILARGMAAYDLADCIRLTIGLPEDMQEVAKSMKEFIS